jgi:ferredoxin
VIYVSDALCTGCGVCVDVCPNGAMQIINNLACIDQSLCQECESCLEVCPQGAIVQVQDPVETENQIPARPVAESASRAIEIAPTVAPPQVSGGIRPWVEMALGFFGREIVPRVVDALADRDRQPSAIRAAQPDDSPQTRRGGGRGGGGRGKRRRRRGRG